MHVPSIYAVGNLSTSYTASGWTSPIAFAVHSSLFVYSPCYGRISMYVRASLPSKEEALSLPSGLRCGYNVTSNYPLEGPV